MIGGLSVREFDRIAGRDPAAMEHSGKHAFLRHHTISDLIINGTAVVAFFADLGDFKLRPADPEP